MHRSRYLRKSSKEISPAFQGMVVRQNFPPDRVRISSSRFSILLSRGSVLFLVSHVPLVPVRSSSSPPFQIFLHRLHCQVLRRGYTISLEQKGQVCIAVSSPDRDVTVFPLCHPVFLTRLLEFCNSLIHLLGFMGVKKILTFHLTYQAGPNHLNHDH